MNSSQTQKLVRGIFESYRTGDREQIESLLSDDFTFTSPYDDHIDRATYFERCWPGAGTFEYHDLKKVFVDGNECFVLYEARATSGAMFRNTEFFQFNGDRIQSVEVFFGLSPQAEPSLPEDEIRT